jgi:hypothetical protein
MKKLKFIYVIKKSLDQYLHIALARGGGGRVFPFYHEISLGIKRILLKISLVW